MKSKPTAGRHIKDTVKDQHDQVITGTGMIEGDVHINEKDVIMVPDIYVGKNLLISPAHEKEVIALLAHPTVAVGQVYPIPEVGDVKVVDLLVKREHPATHVVITERYTNTDEISPDDLLLTSVSLKYPRPPRTDNDVYKSLSLKEVFDLMGDK